MQELNGGEQPRDGPVDNIGGREGGRGNSLRVVRSVPVGKEGVSWNESGKVLKVETSIRPTTQNAGEGKKGREA